MTATVQTSSILSQSDYHFKNYGRKRSMLTENFYQATITDFDGRALKNYRYFHFIGVVRRHYRAFTRRSGYDVW